MPAVVKKICILDTWLTKLLDYFIRRILIYQTDFDIHLYVYLRLIRGDFNITNNFGTTIGYFDVSMCSIPATKRL